MINITRLKEVHYLSDVSAVALVCSEDNALTGMITVGSTALAYYKHIPPSCCRKLTSYGEKDGLSSASTLY
jgi:hypothetical protein